MSKLDGLKPELVAKVQKVLNAMRDLGYPMMVVQGLRTTEQQQALFAQGRTTPGHIVTNADGVNKLSKHQTGDAVDCAFVDANGQPSFDAKLPWGLYGAMGQTLGLIWGGGFHILDLDHLELP